MRKREKFEKEKRTSLGEQKEEVIFPVAPLTTKMSKGYLAFLKEIKSRIQQDRLRVVLAGNAALINLYWDIGQGIIKKQANEGWGSKVIDRLSIDLGKAFPDMKGFSPGILSTCVLLLMPGRIRQLCNGSLH